MIITLEGIEETNTEKMITKHSCLLYTSDAADE